MVASKIGLGHLMRCIAVAQQARDLKIRTIFIVHGDKVVSNILKKHKFAFRKISNIQKSLTRYITDIKNKPVLIDSKKDISELVKGLRKQNLN